ncbi:MAG: DUF429 domain-containing protein [Methanophagales archaeon]|nr:DUF429 domain-containing protein [Methanophagales archaeon]
MKIIGIDLAWKSKKNTSALAIGELNGDMFRIDIVHEALAGLDAIVNVVEQEGDVQGVAIDAPLVIINRSRQRSCERELSKVYGDRRASCHASNLSLYPEPTSCTLSRRLQKKGFKHLMPPGRGQWQLECYPHPAIIEIFGLSERLAYKKGKVAEKRQGQANLAKHIKSLEESQTLRLKIGSGAGQFLSEERIFTNKGMKLQENEDALDSILCAYIGALYARSVPYQVFGSIETGYIYVPQQKCI